MNRLRSEWVKCVKCDLHKYRKKVVIGKGPIPADIMFIGEGPGRSEDMVGDPFVGPSGRVLRLVIEDAREELGIIDESDVPAYFTNLVACRPCDGKNQPNRAPTGKEVWSCFKRLEELERLVKPIQVILLGRVPNRFLRRVYQDAIHIEHPSSINRKGGVSGPYYPKYVQDFVQLYADVLMKKERKNV